MGSCCFAEGSLYSQHAPPCRVPCVLSQLLSRHAGCISMSTARALLSKEATSVSAGQHAPCARAMVCFIVWRRSLSRDPVH